jgi:DNA transformation protein
MGESEKEFVSHVVELMQSVGPVRARRMFGGHGIFLHDVMFGLVADSVLYLKSDARTREEFLTRGLEAFAYTRQGKMLKMSYHRAPEEALEDPGAMHAWARKAQRAALRAAAGRPGKRPGRRRPE